MQQQAELIATLLKGAWRKNPPNANIQPGQFRRIVPPLVQSGVGALAWRAIADDQSLCSEQGWQVLKNAHHYTVLQSAVKADALSEVAALLFAAGIETLIFKGWAAAQSYAEPDARPLGDFDICVSPGRLAQASSLLAEHSDRSIQSDRFKLGPGYGPFHVQTSSGNTCVVDLHRDLDKFALPSLAMVFESSIAADIGGVPVRILRPEDHLRLVIMHFLIHGGRRPLWLTDICAMLEAVPRDFDWQLCLGSNQQLALWMACAIELAHRLLGAKIDHMPSRYRVKRMPSWLERTVLSEWQLGYADRLERPPIWNSKLKALPNELWIRWPNAIRIAMENNRSVHRPPVFLQLADFSRETRRWVRRASTQGEFDAG